MTSSGATAAASANDAVNGADVVITMLPASEHVEGIYLGPEGLLTKIASNALVIDCSTIAADSARKVACAAASRGLAMIDAPVSGHVTSVHGARPRPHHGHGFEAMLAVRACVLTASCIGKAPP